MNARIRRQIKTAELLQLAARRDACFLGLRLINLQIRRQAESLGLRPIELIAQVRDIKAEAGI